MIPAARLKLVEDEASLILWTVDKVEAVQVASGWAEGGIAVRTLRGSRMRAVAGLFDEVAAAMEFPAYFGRNWAAFDECLADMEWLLPATGIAIVVHDAAQVLLDEPEELAVLVRVLRAASDEYGAPVALGEWWDRPAVPFHVILHDVGRAADEAAARWSAAGARLERLG